MKACLFGSLIIFTLILSSVLFCTPVQEAIELVDLSFSPPPKLLDARWDFSADTSIRAIGWPKSYASSTVWKTRYPRFMLILPMGFGGVYTNVWASAWRTEYHIDEIALQFSAESLKDAQARAERLKHDLNLDGNFPDRNYLQTWADRASHEYFHYNEILNRSESTPENPDWPPVGVNMKPNGYNNLWCVTLGVRLPRD
jgi:hypothetical protein